MSIHYAAVKWNRNKRIYDAVIASGIALYLSLFVVVGRWLQPKFSVEVLAIRALGTCAFLMLHVVLCIGPLARFDRRLLPLLYNRRHLGVATFGLALAHGSLATGFYHGFGRLNPLLSLISTNVQYDSVGAFPFEILGLIALVILFLMAATSHDFWLKNLSPSVWKALHMLVYIAYGLLVMHVALGALQSERYFLPAFLLFAGACIVSGLHLAAGWREHRADHCQTPVTALGWIDIGNPHEIPDGRAHVVAIPGGERVAVFRQGHRISAVSNVCAHQGGPLGEGKIVEGCITCPWHGWEYRPDDGCSPPPFAERIATYRIHIADGRFLLHPVPLRPGTRVEPVCIEDSSHVSTRIPVARSGKPEIR